MRVSPHNHSLSTLAGIQRDKIADGASFVYDSSSHSWDLQIPNDSGMINVMASPYNAKNDGSTDDTTAIQAAIDAANSDGKKTRIWCPPGLGYVISQLRLYKGITIVGAGMGASPHRGSMFIQKDGVNDSAFVNDPTAVPATDYLHWTRLQDIQIRKATGSTDTLGSGFRLTCRTGEGFRLEHVHVYGFPENGISLEAGGAPCWLNDIRVLNNGAYGLNLQRGGSDAWQTVGVVGISGDNNGTALIRVKTAGGGQECFRFADIKSETSSAGKQLYVIELDTTNGSPVVLENLGILADLGVTGTAVVHILGSNAKFEIHGQAVTGFTHLIQDDFNTVNYDTFNEIFLTWAQGKVLTHVNSSGLLLGSSGAAIKAHLSGTATWDPPSIAAGIATSTTVTVTGAVVGDVVSVGFSQAVPAGAILVGSVTAADTVTVTLMNHTGGALNLASGTIRASVWQY